MFRTFLSLVWLAVAGPALMGGLDYYALPHPDRAYSSLHSVYAPSGRIGLSLGVIGTTMIVTGVFLYALRKRAGWLRNAGKLRYWLEFHIFLCTLGPFLILLHTSFKFGGVVSIAFWSMALVVGSGVFGRYVYVRIPKTINGQFLGIGALEEQKSEMLAQARASSDLDLSRLESVLDAGPLTRPRSTAHALLLAAKHDWRRRGQLREIRRALDTLEAPPATRERLYRIGRDQLRLRQQAALLQPFQRLFRYWHVFHLPLALLMLLILGIHVGVAVMFGYAWGG